jgi:ADP-heptose:LPS heptosyltransferase
MLGFKRTYKLPFKCYIPNYTQDFLADASLLRCRLKYIKRLLFLLIRGQKSLEVDNILSEHQRILWINLSAPSIGDSLMDLSSRILLKNKKIDLFTSKKNGNLYKNDQFFNSIFTKKDDVNRVKYDLVIIDSFSSRSINIKCQIAPKIHYVGMFGYFNGPEVNRVLFSFHRMNQLLGYIKSEIELSNIAKCSISISKSDEKFVNNLKLPMKYIAIAIGGEWKYRTYEHWKQIIQELKKIDNNLPIVLLGSKNAEDSITKILDSDSSTNVINSINKYTFNQTTEIIKRAKVLLCCDGGLMHAANAVNTPIIAMFARLSPKMQLTQSIRAETFYDKKDVNNILVKDIIFKYKEFFKFDHSNLKDE